MLSLSDTAYPALVNDSDIRSFMGSLDLSRRMV